LLGAGVASDANSGQGGLVGTQVPGSNSPATVTPGTSAPVKAPNVNVGSNNISVDVGPDGAVSVGPGGAPGAGRTGSTLDGRDRRGWLGGGCCHRDRRLGGLECRHRQFDGHGW
jgi:hypothetical protein